MSVNISLLFLVWQEAANLTFSKMFSRNIPLFLAFIQGRFRNLECRKGDIELLLEGNGIGP